ncbi:hypothetical protein AB4K20DRAFT_2006086 [Rhizopus microsporus]|uniref:Uncharacterized protein n=1 Tax=Rhizopus microsporus TaxID=58291 RepID=A0A1X0SEN4_RHIZD|nr:hypothetical protein BCV71DRAFT_285793 [Rhizopus microsporus]
MIFLYTLEQLLLTFRLPQDRLPGSDLISKAILKENKSDETRSDVVYIPRLSINKSLPPFLIEVQRTVGESFMQRNIHYCIYINRAFDRKPVVLIFTTNNTCPYSLLEQFKPSLNKTWLITCNAHCFWAKNCFMVIKQTLNVTNETSMEPLLTIALFGYTCAANTTIKMLYGLAKDYTLQGKERQDNFADVIDVICDTHIKQLKQAHAIVSDSKKVYENH